MGVTKEEVEDLLKLEISDDLFKQSLRYAEKKQNYIYSQNPRAIVLEHWYLTRLTMEYARSLAFSHFTMDLCEMLSDMEKEHSVKDQSTPSSTHIVAY